MTPQHHIANELASHAGALRALARDLVGPADAADLVQETALRALRSPPSRPQALGAWLATVLRNLAGNHRRTAARRRARESEVGHQSVATATAPAADDQLARHESVRLVTEALWRLPEPYQATLVQRYFEGLSPKQIAAREDIPIATVKSRLQRGLAQLRSDCDREDGGRWRALLPLVLGKPKATVAAAGTAALLMTQTTKVILAAGVLVALACIAFGFDGEPVKPLTTERESHAPASTVDREAEPRALAKPRSAAPKRVDPQERVDRLLAHKYEFSLPCRVIDRDGLPVAGAKVALGIGDEALNLWPERTDSDGRVRLVWRGKCRDATIAVGLKFRGYGMSLRELRVGAGRDRELTLLAELGGGGAVCNPAVISQNVACSQCHRGSILPNVFGVDLRLADGLHPYSRFQAHLLDQVAQTDESVPGSVPPAPPPPEGEEVFEVSETESSDDGRVCGTVYDDLGQPVAGATVIWGLEPDKPYGRTQTSSDGTYVLKGVAPGEVLVRAGGGATGIGRTTALVAKGQETPRDLHLVRGREIVGQVVVPQGESAEGWRVEFEARNGTWADGTEVRADGTFALANMPSTRGRLLLWTRQSDPLPIAVHDVMEFGRPEVLFDVVKTGMPAARLNGKIGDGPGGHIRVWHDASGRGTIVRAGKEGRLSVKRVAPGRYRAMFLWATHAARAMRHIRVEGEGVVDLGVRTLPDQVRVAFDWSGFTEASADGAYEVPTVECYRRGEDVDVRHPVALTPGRDVELAPGRWCLLWRDRGELRLKSFYARAGNDTVVRLGIAPR